MEEKLECDLGRLEDILVQVCKRRHEAMERAAMGITAALGHVVGPTCFEEGTPEITVISVCRDWTSKDMKNAFETFKALLGRSR
ncbi:hypothetical protein CRG98_016036 [Punica granatum]|uniref:Uncharacterized protein n=1 Tax=Punica granatum TaxID=22663 RepID=A0A2I0K4U5_PUNGR|nr:hypothetical protein CRG98_016036 [Punica granatum]